MALLPDGQAEIVVEAHGLTKRYGKNEALKDVSFSIREREIVGLIGPNGAGKSTTMNILSGYLSPTEGQVRICGVDLLADPVGARRHIGYLPEIPPLYMDMTVEEQVCFTCALSGVKKRGRELREYALQLCEKTQVAHMRSRLIRNLSKGYRQRVAVAQLLAGDPDILILDEPTVGLDPRQIREFRDLFLELGKTHTVIFSSHILSEINSICSRVFIFEQGRILADGRPADLQRELGGADITHLRLHGNWQDALKRIAGIDGVEQVYPSDPGDAALPEEDAACMDIYIRSRTGADIPGPVNRQVRLAGCEILLMQPEQMSLEDIYLRLTSQDLKQPETPAVSGTAEQFRRQA